MIGSLRAFLLIGVAVYLFIVLYMMKTSRFSVKYALIWIIGGVLMLLFAVFPQWVFDVSALVGISDPVNAVFFLFACFTIVMLLSLTSIVTELAGKNLRLIQSQSLLEKRVRELEKIADADKKQ